MKAEELAFLNQQLAGMLESGIPLEVSLRQLAGSMQRGELRMEIERLEAALRNGVPLREAISQCAFPALYKRLVQVGIAANDMPAVLTMAADYYGRVNSLWTRFQGVMVYPLIVLLAALGLSVFLTSISVFLFRALGEDLNLALPGLTSLVAALWLPPLLLLIGVIVFLVLMNVPRLRCALNWRLPGFKEANLSQLASSLALALRAGVPFGDAISFVRELECEPRVRRELASWERRLARGEINFARLAEGGTVVPPLFVWVVASGGERIESGFSRAGQLYYDRAMRRVEMLLYAALPVSVLLLGLLILAQIVPVITVFSRFLAGTIIT